MRALVLALLALALAPAVASAHATLDGTVPERGARLDAAPGEVVLRFSEGVEASFGALRVYDAEGREVQAGEPYRPGGRANEVAVPLEPGLGDGGYTATYRVISADSHPVSGGFVFVVGDGTAPGATVAELLGDDEAGPVTGTAFGVVRAVQFGAIGLALGGLAFLLACWLPGLRAAAGGAPEWRAASQAFAARLRAMLLAAAAAGAVSAALALVFQGAVASGGSVWSALDPAVVREVLGTRFGVVWACGVLAWLLAGALIAARPSAVPELRTASVGATGLALPGRRGLAPAAVPLLALAALPALGGHASVQEPVALLLPANVLHVLAAGAWVGGIAVLAVALRKATAELAPEDRSRLLAGVVARFSTLAGIAVAVLALSGVVQGLVEVRTPANLVDTAFGRAVLVKSALFGGVVALGWLNRARLLPALRRAAAGGAPPGRTGALLRRVLRAELALGVAALLTTGALAGYAPSVAEGTGPFSTSADLGPARIEVTVDPARTGPNELHVYLFDRADGSQWDETKELSLSAGLPGEDIPPIDLRPTKAGPGHYVVSGAALPVTGEWTLEVASRVSAFDEYRTTFPVEIR